MKRNLLEKAECLFSDCDIVSFDIFGTLLTRLTPSPKAVFDIVESTVQNRPFISNTSFRQKRHEADHHDVNGRIPTLQEIYQRLDLDDQDVQRYVETEQAIERDILVPNPQVQQIYNLAQTLGKTIVITSDMYFSSAFLADLLHEKGYDGFDRIFVSSEYNQNKGSGKLFDSVLTHYNVKPSALVHIGDSLKADCLGARKRGIKSLYIGEKPSRKLFDKVCGTKTISPVLIHSFPDKSDLFHIGFRSLGPLLVSFSQWLHENLSNAPKQSQVFFLARDSKVLLDAYITLYPEEASRVRYVYLSRKSIGLASLTNYKDLRSIKNELSFQRYISWASFMDNLAIRESDWTELLKDEEFPFYEYRTRDAFFADPDVERFFSILLPLIERKREEQQSLLKEYLETMGFNESAIIIDIGWHGTLQRMLEHLFKMKLTGFYMGTCSTTDCDASGFLFDDNDLKNDDIMAAFGCLFETFFFAGHGTTLEYRKNENGLAEPVLDENEYSESDMRRIEEFQEGAMTFVDLFARAKIVDFLPIDKEQAFEQIKRIGYNPSSKSVREFGRFSYSEYGVIAPLVPEHIPWRNRVNPRLFIQGFFLTKWKSGYLKKTLGLPLPYGSLYTLSRKLFKKA